PAHRGRDDRRFADLLSAPGAPPLDAVRARAGGPGRRPAGGSGPAHDAPAAAATDAGGPRARRPAAGTGHEAWGTALDLVLPNQLPHGAAVPARPCIPSRRRGAYQLA